MKLVDLQNRSPFGPQWGARRRGPVGQRRGSGGPLAFIDEGTIDTFDRVQWDNIVQLGSRSQEISNPYVPPGNIIQFDRSQVITDELVPA